MHARSMFISTARVGKSINKVTMIKMGSILQNFLSALVSDFRIRGKILYF